MLQRLSHYKFNSSFTANLKQYWYLNRKFIVGAITVLFIAFSSVLFLHPQTAKASLASESNVTLFTSNEWKSLVNQYSDSDNLSQKLLLKLNSKRDIIGKSALGIVHPNANVKYERTDSVFVSPRDGGGYIYAFVIHWFRSVAVGLGKNLTTKITWEIVDNNHFQAKIVEDNSLFPPVDEDKLNNFFRGLIESNN